LIFVKNAISIGGSFNISVDQSFFKVNDPVNKTVSEFHFYGPIEYTHQFASWIPAFRDQEGGTYPDPSRFTINGSSIWNSVGVATDNIPVGTTDWTYFESDRISLQDADVVLGIPVLEGQAVDNGRAFFDDVVIKEYDSNGNFLRNIFEIDGFIPDGWFHWAADGYLLGTWNDGAGREDNSAFVASGANGPTNISFWANRFPLTQGHSYQVTGWMRGENIPVGAMARIRLDYESTIDPNFSIETRNRDLLENRLLEYVEWGNRNNVPMYLGEFGCIRDCFENNRGGLNWVRDVISIAKENDMHFNYHAYHEDGFGIYRGYGTLVDPANANSSF